MAEENRNIDYKEAYMKETATSMACMQRIHNLTRENENLKAEVRDLIAENKTLQSRNEGNALSVILRAVSENNLQIHIEPRKLWDDNGTDDDED